MIATFALLLLAGADPGAADPDAKICRTEQKTGTRVSRNRVCLTKAEWTERERMARIERMQTNGQLRSRAAQGPASETGFP